MYVYIHPCATIYINVYIPTDWQICITTFKKSMVQPQLGCLGVWRQALLPLVLISERAKHHRGTADRHCSALLGVDLPGVTSPPVSYPRAKLQGRDSKRAEEKLPRARNLGELVFDVS